MTDHSIILPWRAVPDSRAPGARPRASVMAALAARAKRLWHAAWYLGDNPADDNW